MRVGLILIAALFLGAFGAHFLMEDRGYVMLSFRGYTAEMSVPVLILGLITLYVGVRVVSRALRAPRNIGRAAGAYRARRARKSLTQGMMEISEGHWARAEKRLARGADRGDTPLLNYLGAARAAQLQGAHERRDSWLKLAYEQDESAATAVLLTQAELQISDKQHEQALATLRKLDEGAPNHTQGLALQARVYEELGDWDHLLALLPRLRRRKALSKGAIDAVAVRVYDEMLQRAGGGENPEAVRALFRGMAKPLQQNPALFRRYVNALARSGAHDDAEVAIRKAIKASWDEELVLTYGEIESGDPAKLLERAEGWLKSRGDDAALLLTAARLSMRLELWGKARSYLESSLAIAPRVDTYHVYGKLLEQLGQTAEAAGAFRSGLALATGQTMSQLPALDGPEPGATATDRADAGTGAATQQKG